MNTKYIAAEYRLSQWAQIMKERKSVEPSLSLWYHSFTEPFCTMLPAPFDIGDIDTESFSRP